ncbi:hypothetical protein ACJVC5_16085 [Peredibacter sp. HCB2-198]|uniref:hypothetical protein n=1 Tax=Peredibacter sp. HCB2-198 TaxID=3383025 RepID=UPI0038B5C011
MKYLLIAFTSLGLLSNAFAYRTVSAGGIRARGGAPLNVNRNLNVNVNRNVNIVGGGWHGYYPASYHPIATAAAVTGAAVVTAAAIGSIVHSIPPTCVNTVVNGVTYSQCGSTWYQPQYVGSSVQYVVVNPPK